MNNSNMLTRDKWLQYREQILQEILPSDEEINAINSIISEIRDLLNKTNSSYLDLPIVKIEAHGSTGIKQTNLKGAADIDLFIFLNFSEYINKCVRFVPIRNKSPPLNSDFGVKSGNKDIVTNTKNKDISPTENKDMTNTEKRGINNPRNINENPINNNNINNNQQNNNINNIQQNNNNRNPCLTSPGNKDYQFNFNGQIISSRTHKMKPNKAEITEIFKNICKNWLIPVFNKQPNYSKAVVSYADHPYVSVEYNDYDIDIVVAFLLDEEFLMNFGPVTAVDRTYYHSKFVKNHLIKEQLNDVRIMKKFFKNQLCYGDKAALGRGGFIGFAIELLIFYFGDIWNLFINFDKLPRMAIDYYKRDYDELRQSPRYMDDFLIIMDPTDKKRNVGSSISSRAWYYCDIQLKNMINDFSIDYFFKNPYEYPAKSHELSWLSDRKKDLSSINLYSDDSIKSENLEQSSGGFDRFLILEFKHNRVEHYTKIRDKIYSAAEFFIKNISEEIDGTKLFRNIDYCVYFNPNKNEYALCLYCSNPKLNEYYIRRGPSIDKKDDCERFKNKNPNSYLEGNFYYVKEKHRFTDFKEAVLYYYKKRPIEELDLINSGSPGSVVSISGMLSFLILNNCILPYSNEITKIKKEILSRKRIKRKRRNKHTKKRKKAI